MMNATKKHADWTVVAPSVESLQALLDLTDPKETAEILDAAYATKCRHVGTTVYFRALVEMSNICSKNCLYCGIRSGNAQVERYTLSKDEIISAAAWADAQDYGSIVLQAGERQDAKFIALIEDVLQTVQERTEGRIGVTLSLGEQTQDTYARWFAAGAHRYLLRIETSNPELYAQIHPADHQFQERLECLHALRRVGYQVGTGVMIGLPGQTTEDLARDILFFKDMDIDMIGMGPYIPHSATPMKDSDFVSEAQLDLALRMIAVTRLVLPDINIAATTALQALNPTGRELGLKAGANIIMPNVTETRYRPAYQLYENKPCIDENATQCRGCLKARIKSIGETIGFGKWGNSPHFSARQPEGASTP
jgi:biotin synthase